MRLGLHVGTLLVAYQADADLDKVADDLFDIAADITDFGEFRRLDLDEGRAGELGQAAGDFRLADAGRADHQDVLRHDFVAQVGIELLAAPAVAQRNRHGALGLVLADDVAVELGDDLAGGKCGHKLYLQRSRKRQSLRKKCVIRRRAFRPPDCDWYKRRYRRRYRARGGRFLRPSCRYRRGRVRRRAHNCRPSRSP